DKLDLHDLLGLVGVDPKAIEGDASEEADPEADGKGGGGLLPDTPLDAERLHAMDMDVRLKGQRVESQSVPMDALDMRFVVEQGRLRVEPLTFFVADGKIEGVVSIDARQDPPAAAVDLAVQQLDL